MIRTLYICLAVLGTISAAEGGAEQFKLDPPDFGPKYIQTWPILQYPEVAQTFHKTGKGWFRLTIDRASGKVREVKVLQTTGVKVLDDAVAVACLQMKLKPNVLDHAVVGVEFRGPQRPRIGSHILW